MNERDTLRPKLDAPRGVLHHRPRPFVAGYERYLPGAALAPFVEHFWCVSWDEPEAVVREVLPHPSVHLVLEAGASAVAGVPSGRFTRVLQGRGRVLGTKFLPGGFHPFFGRDVSSLTDRRVPLVEIFGAAAGELERHALACGEASAAFAVVQEFLLAREPRRDPSAELAARIAARAATDRDIVRAEQLAAAFDLGLRALQRLFATYVGVPPKWVLQRYRLHEAAERLADEPDADLADLASELGYADQSHFVRDFKRLIGHPPGAYARRVAAIRT